MPIHKVTDFLSEISAFLKKDNVHNAMYSIKNVIKWLKVRIVPVWNEEKL